MATDRLGRRGAALSGRQRDLEEGACGGASFLPQRLPSRRVRTLEPLGSLILVETWNSGSESSVVIHDDATCRHRSRRRGPISTGTRLHDEHGAGMGLVSSTANPERRSVCGRGIGRPDIGTAIVWHLHWLPRQEHPQPNVWRQLRIRAPVGALLLIEVHCATPWRGARSCVGHVCPCPARRTPRSGSPECQKCPSRRGAGLCHPGTAPGQCRPDPGPWCRLTALLAFLLYFCLIGIRRPSSVIP